MRARRDAAGGVKLLVVLMGLGWGVNWIAARFILEALPPWTMRTIGIGLIDLTMFAAAAISGISLAVPRSERGQDPDRGNLQRRGVQRRLRLRAGLRHHLARHRHRLFDADLVGAARAFRAQGKAQRREARRARVMRGRTGDPDLSAGARGIPLGA